MATCLIASVSLGQRSEVPVLTQQQPDSRTVLGPANEYLSAGAEAIRVKQNDEGIRLTKLGIERPA
jgi:hypothetical protein